MKHLRTYIKNLLKILGGLGMFLIPLHAAKAFWPLLFLVGGVGSALFSGYLGDLTKNSVIFIIKWILIILGWVGSYILALSGSLLDWAINNTILNPNFGAIKAINVGWEAARDVANLFFIFILLYIAIATILRVNEANTKRMLASVVIIALLMNFSLFFTKVIVDVSNTLAIGVYSSLYTSNASISAVFSDGLKIQQILETPENDGGLKDQQQVVVLFGALVVYITAAWVFFNAVFLLLGRFIVLIFLMILSPFAFISYILPKTRSLIFDKWLNTLTNQAIVAPLFMFLLLISVRVMQSGVFTTGVDSDSSAFMFNLFIGLGLLIGTLKITRMVSGDIGAQATKFGKAGIGLLAGGIGGFAMRNTLGRAAKGIAGSNAMQKFAASGAAGRAAERLAQRGASSSMDFRNIPNTKEFGSGGGRGGYSKKLDSQVKTRVDQAKRIETNKFGNKNYIRATQEETVNAGYVNDAGTYVPHQITVAAGEIMPTVHEERDAQGNITRTFAGKTNKEVQKDANGNDILDANGNKIMKTTFTADKRTFKDDYVDTLMEEREGMFGGLGRASEKKAGWRQATKDRAAAAKLKGGSQLDQIKNIVNPPSTSHPTPSSPPPATPPPTNQPPTPTPTT